MSCVSPLLVKSRNGIVLASCGRCLSCSVKKQSELTFLCHKELRDTYHRGLGASFVTLTYNDNNVPYVAADKPYQTLQIDDFQKFLKRFRYYSDKQYGIQCKFLACGEYGDKLGRPHYHAVIFGLSDYLCDKLIRSSWKYGTHQVGALGSGGLRYVLKYLTKTRLTPEIKAFYDANGVQKPFILHSQKLGFDWISRNKQQIVDSHYTFLSNGKVRLYPKYVRDVVERLTGVDSRPFVQDYLSHVNTHGELLDDFFARQTYIHEMDLCKQYRLDNKAVTLPFDCRRPQELRSTFNTDYKLAAMLALEN